MKSYRIIAGIALLWIVAGVCHALSGLAVTLPSSPPSQAQKADAVVILKKDHVLELLAGGKVIRTYKVALGRGGLAPKEREGDARTPEGHYLIDSSNAVSHYHRALHVSYPNPEDRKHAALLGVPPGGAIMIHGLPNGMGWLGATHRLYDWTLGCIAVTDEEIDEIWNLVPVGTPVEIRPEPSFPNPANSRFAIHRQKLADSLCCHRSLANIHRFTMFTDI
jgi:murein L,D-transpeptidase YafK